MYDFLARLFIRRIKGEKTFDERGEDVREDICQRFNSLHWHDSKLTGVRIVRNEGSKGDDVHFEIQLLTNPRPGNNQWTNATLIMKDCAFIKMDVDLAGKRVCSDDMSGASCQKESAFRDRIEREQQEGREGLMLEPLSDFLHFHISLIPPGGEINVLAKDFELVLKPT